jgi:hypothetical protein
MSDNILTIQEAVQQVRSWSQDRFAAELSDFMDEQPALFAFLLNLSEEFEDQAHDLLVHSALILREGFTIADIPVKTITDAIIEDATRDVTESMDADGAADLIDAENMARRSRSPFVFQEVRQYLHDQLTLDVEKDVLSEYNLLIVVDVMIGCFEEALDLGDDADAEAKNK